jgi:hypothetical protein
MGEVGVVNNIIYSFLFYEAGNHKHIILYTWLMENYDLDYYSHTHIDGGNFKA